MSLYKQTRRRDSLKDGTRSIRTLRTITINGKSPKMLSEVPSNSWTFDGNTLTITDPKAFWSANNRILVIQVK